MSVIQPIYDAEHLPYRLPNALEGNNRSTIDGMVSPISKNFIFKPAGSDVVYVKIDFLKVDNQYIIDNILTNP